MHGLRSPRNRLEICSWGIPGAIFSLFWQNSDVGEKGTIAAGKINMICNLSLIFYLPKILSIPSTVRLLMSKDPWHFSSKSPNCPFLNWSVPWQHPGSVEVRLHLCLLFQLLTIVCRYFFLLLLSPTNCFWTHWSGFATSSGQRSPLKRKALLRRGYVQVREISLLAVRITICSEETASSK